MIFTTRCTFAAPASSDARRTAIATSAFAMAMPAQTDETSRAILSLIAQGHDVPDILAQHATLTPEDVQAAAAEALRTLEEGPRVETRAERIERLRQRWPNAYAPWTDDEDARLVQRWDEGARLAPLSRELGRPPGAIRARLERHLGPRWHERHRATAPDAHSSSGPSSA